MSIQRILRIARKDFWEQIRNWRLLFYGLYLVVWFAILGVVNWSGIFPVIIVLHAPQDSAMRAEVIHMELTFPGFITVLESDSAERVPELMQAEEADLGVIVPADFDRLIANGELASLEFFLVEGSGFSRTLQSIIEGFAEGLAPPPKQVLEVESTTLEIEKNGRRKLVVEPLLPFGIVTSLEILMIFLLLVDQGSNALFVIPGIIHEERKQRTLEALLISPLSHFELVIGKFLAAWSYGMITSSFFLLPIIFVAQNPLLLIATVFLATSVLNMFGMLVGVIFTNEQVSNSFISLFALPWTFSTYLGWLLIDGPWWLDGTLLFVPTVQMGQAMLYALINEPMQALQPLLLLMGQLVLFVFLMVTILKRQENV